MHEGDRSQSPTPPVYVHPRGASTTPNITCIERKRLGRGRCLASAEEEETPRQGNRKSEKENTTLDLLLKHPKTTIATYD